MKNKYLLPILFLVQLAYAQIMPAEYYYLDIDPLMRSVLPDVNPAYLASGNTPYQYAFQYRNHFAEGDFRLPFTPERKSYQNISVSAFHEMKNGTLFAGQFTYRYEQRKNKLWLHNAETYIDIPFYFADSSTGDFDLNGIDWNVVFSYPFTASLRGGLDIFYNVDEQFKSVFPKPNIKRNNVIIRPGLALKRNNFQLGGYASLFQFKEEMNTRRYSLEQGLSPTLMRIRGLDKPFLTYAQTSAERLQTVNGYGIGGDLKMGKVLSLSSELERGRAYIVDGGAYPEPQGDWDLKRFAFRAELDLKAVFFFELLTDRAEGFHPSFGNRVFARLHRHYEGGISLPFRGVAGEIFTGNISYAFCDLLREDNFVGLLHYFPENILSIDIHYQYDRQKIRYEFGIGYRVMIDAAESIIYDDMSGWYYKEITEREIAYYEQNCSTINAALKISIPFGKNRLQFSGDLIHILPENAETRYLVTQTGISLIF